VIRAHRRGTSEASLRPPSPRPPSSASRSGRSAIRASSLRDPRSLRPTAAVRCAEVRSASRPAGHSESGWSDDVSADVERTPDSTSSSQNLPHLFSSQPPRKPSLPLGRSRRVPGRDGSWPSRGVTPRQPLRSTPIRRPVLCKTLYPGKVGLRLAGTTRVRGISPSAPWTPPLQLPSPEGTQPSGSTSVGKGERLPLSALLDAEHHVALHHELNGTLQPSHQRSATGTDEQSGPVLVDRLEDVLA
jgi:hypothetical protein